MIMNKEEEEEEEQESNNHILLPLQANDHQNIRKSIADNK